MMFSYGFIGKELDSTVFFTITYSVTITLLKALSPLFILVIILAMATNWMQFGFVTVPLKFDLQKLDPIKGIQKYFWLKKTY
jgi:flagellar biosynthesis protein FlhB